GRTGHRWTASSARKHLVEEGDRAREGVDPVRELRDRVPLVRVHDQLAPDPLLAQYARDLLRLRQRNTGVVRAVLDEQWRADRVHVRGRRRLDEEVAVVLERAVLPFA